MEFERCLLPVSTPPRSVFTLCSIPSFALKPPGTGVASFFLDRSCSPPSSFFGLPDGVSSSAKMVSSLDSTPAKKEFKPHFEDGFDVVGGADAISGTLLGFAELVAV